MAISEEMAVVEITDHPLISDIRFPFENTLMDPNDVVVGDQVNLTYVRKLVPADVGVTDVGSWCLTRKYLDGTVVSMDENQVVVRPLPEDPLAGQVETLRFLRNNRFTAGYWRSAGGCGWHLLCPRCDPREPTADRSGELGCVMGSRNFTP